MCILIFYYLFFPIISTSALTNEDFRKLLMTPRSGAPSVAPPSARSSSHSSKSTSSSIHSHRTSRWDMSLFWVLSLFRLNCFRKIPKISPWSYIFQRPFLRGLFLEGLIFGRVYLWREICVSKSIGLAL